MIAITVEFELQSDRVEDFREVVLAQARNSLKKETGCHRFDVCLDEEQPTVVLLYEVYDDEAAFQQHLKTEHFADFNTRVSDWVKRKLVRAWTRVEV